MKNIQTENKYMNAVKEGNDAVIPKAKTYDDQGRLVRRRSSASSLTETPKGFTASDIQGEALDRLVTNASFSKAVNHKDLLLELKGKSSAEIQTILHEKGIIINTDKLQDSFAELNGIEKGVREVAKKAEEAKIAYKTPKFREQTPTPTPATEIPVGAQPDPAVTPPATPTADATPKNWIQQQWDSNPWMVGAGATVATVGTAGTIGAAAQASGSKGS
jgi:hypothetical protein